MEVIRKLTPRQQQIVKLKLNGLTYRQIAEELGIRHQTVKNQAFWAMARTGAASITELCVWYLAEQGAQS